MTDVEPRGGFSGVTVAEPEVPVAVNPFPVAVPCEHEYVIVVGEPRSTRRGLHESYAVICVFVGVVGAHCVEICLPYISFVRFCVLH